MRVRPPPACSRPAPHTRPPSSATAPPSWSGRRGRPNRAPTSPRYARPSAPRVPIAVARLRPPPPDRSRSLERLSQTRRTSMRSKHIALVVSLAAALASMAGTVGAHGMAGKRFFPATLATDDPFVADELSLPTVSTIRTPDDGGTRETDISVDIAKRI